MNKNYKNNICKSAVDLLKKQPYVPAKLLETYHNEDCMCVGAAVLYAAYLEKGGSDQPKSFFNLKDNATELDFVKVKSKKLGLNANKIWNIMEASKVLSAEKRLEMAEFNISRNLGAN